MNISVYLHIAGLYIYEKVVPHGETDRYADSEPKESQYCAEEPHLEVRYDELSVSTAFILSVLCSTG